MCTFLANVAFDKATNGQLDIKHEMGKTLCSMSLLKVVGEKLPPSQRSSLEKWSLFAATANAETQFVEDAVRQLLKARRVLKCSYVYGYYLDGPGYKKIVFEFMQVRVVKIPFLLLKLG